MPFGLNNSASAFQRTMEMALQGLQWRTYLIYIDDIIALAELLKSMYKGLNKYLKELEELVSS